MKPQQQAIESYKAELKNTHGFLCNVCCQNGRLFCDPADGSVIFDCPDHLRLVLSETAVLAAQTLGVRH